MRKLSITAIIIGLLIATVYGMFLIVKKDLKPVAPISTAECSYQNKGLVIVCYVTHDSKTYVLVEAKK